MAQPESQSSEFEASKAPNGSTDLPESQIDEPALAEKTLSEDQAFQSSVGEMLDSIETESIEETTSASESEEGKSADSEDAFVDPADELLIRAGSILNGEETEIPNVEVEAEPRVEDDEDLMDFPDPQSLLLEQDEEVEANEAASGESGGAESGSKESEGLVSMPDPQSLIKEASDDTQIAPRDEGAEPTSEALPEEIGKREENEESKAEDNPQLETFEEVEPIEKSEELGEDKKEAVGADLPEDMDQAAESEESGPSVELQAIEETAKVSDSENLESVSGEVDADAEDEDDSLLDDDAGDDLFLDSEDGFSISDDDDLIDVAAQPWGADEQSSQKQSGSARVSRYIAWPVAAGLAFVGLSILAASFRAPILDLLTHGDIQETRIHHVVAEMTERVFDGIEPGQPYELAWIESDIKRVSESEYRVIAKIGARLKENLFAPLDENYVYTLLPFTRSQLEKATAFVDEPGELSQELKLPKPGWTRLYRRQGAKGEVFEIDIQYRITANDDKPGSWELSSLRLNGNGDGLDWTSIMPKSAFEEGAVDVDAMEFAYYLRAFEKAGLSYLEKAKAFEDVWIASRTEKAERLQKLRKELIMSLSQGSYFKGIAIVGETSEETREISLIVTETRADGELIKGLLKLENEEASPKHFTGVLDIIENEDSVQGHLELTTVAFAGQPHDTPELAFFKPGTVSRIQMNTDGRTLEGDSDSISLRLMRGR